MPDTPKNLSRTGGLLILGLMFATIAGLSYFAFRAVDQRQSVENRDDQDQVAKTDEDEDEENAVGNVLDSLIDNGDTDKDDAADDNNDQLANNGGGDADITGDSTTKTSNATLPSTGPSVGQYLIIVMVSAVSAMAYRLQLARRS